jgi:hypothetical protein
VHVYGKAKDLNRALSTLRTLKYSPKSLVNSPRLHNDVGAAFGKGSDGGPGVGSWLLVTRLPLHRRVQFQSIMGDNIRWKGVYSFLCGMANHPTLNVIELIDSDSPGSHQIRISDEALSQQVKATIGPYLRSLHFACAYMGWPTAELDAMYDEVVDE